MYDFAKLVRDIHDFPKKGVVFRDITPLIRNSSAFSEVIDIFYNRYKDKKIKYVACIESRGFIFGAALALKLNAGIIPIRKKGKLPHITLSESYALEYGTDSVEIHKDAIEKGDKVLLVDDLIATGGTLGAAANLIKSTGAELIEIALLIELSYLKGRDNLKDYPIFTLITY